MPVIDFDASASDELMNYADWLICECTTVVPCLHDGTGTSALYDAVPTDVAVSSRVPPE